MLHCQRRPSQALVGRSNQLGRAVENSRYKFSGDIDLKPRALPESSRATTGIYVPIKRNKPRNFSAVLRKCLIEKEKLMLCCRILIEETEE